MPKRKPKAPFATVLRIPVVKMGAPEWSRIECAFGHSLPIDLRTEIVADTQSFVTLAAFEYAAPPVDAAVKRIKRLREFARELLCLLDSKMLSSLRGSSALYADELIAWHLYKVVLKPSQEHKYLAPFAEEIRLFEKACAWALDQIDRTSYPGYWQTGEAWNNWILAVTETVRKHKLPSSVRKDTDKNKLQAPSSFVNLILELQKTLPREYRRHTTPDGASQAIVRARRVTNQSRTHRKCPAAG
jgi:hypothetical protein